jgi:hypothetical protein
MLPRSYRIEHQSINDSHNKYFLVKDLKVGGKNAKVRRYIGSGPLPPPEEIERLSRKLALDIEVEAIKKSAVLSSARYKPRYLGEGRARLIEQVRYTYKALILDYWPKAECA